MKPTTTPAKEDLSNGSLRTAVEEQLERVLRSSHFRGSQPCLKFLDYIVRRALDGQYDLLHQRCLGMDLFGRSSSYEPSEDSIVRVKAYEVRQRLAQYYAEPQHQEELRIELPTGSYVPAFVWPSVPRDTEPHPPAAAPLPQILSPVRNRTRAIAVTGGLLVLGAAACGVAFWLGRSQSPLEQFWSPVRQSSKPIMLTLGHASVYELSSRASREYFKTHLLLQGGEPLSILPDPAFALSSSDLIPRQGHFVGAGGAQAVLRFAALFGGMRRSCYLRTGTDFSYSDLRNQPSILLGAFSSCWAPLLTKNLRFRFDRADGVARIRDTWKRDRVWMLADPPNLRNLIDYAIVARISHSETGELLIIAAGITHHGTASAAEFLTEPAIFARAMRSAPSDWQSKRMQLVIQTKVIEGTPGPPEVLASHFW